MTVNNIPLAIGQKWKTRGGDEVEIIDNVIGSVYPWDLSNGCTVNCEGKFRLDNKHSDTDLITLIQDEHGFIPWNGGECPVGESVEVEVEFRAGGETVDDAGNFRWGHNKSSGDIITYRVVQQEVKPTKVDAEENKEVVKMNQKYTVKDVLYALDNLSDEYIELDLEEQIEEYLAVRESSDYKLYLELKAKFEYHE